MMRLHQRAVRLNKLECMIEDDRLLYLFRSVREEVLHHQMSRYEHVDTVTIHYLEQKRVKHARRGNITRAKNRNRDLDRLIKLVKEAE
jgi:hypothetical protein